VPRANEADLRALTDASSKIVFQRLPLEAAQTPEEVDFPRRRTDIEHLRNARRAYRAFARHAAARGYRRRKRRHA